MMPIGRCSSGAISLMATNAGGAATSRSAVLTVSNPTVPAEFADLYPALQTPIGSFNQAVSTAWNGQKSSVAFGGELPTANANQGRKLLSGTALTSVQITDTLGNFGTPGTGTLPAPGQYVITSGPTVGNQTGGAALVASNAFNGAGANAGLLAGASTLPAGATASVAFTIRFFPRYAGQCVNQAVVSGLAGGSTISTASSNGTSPDPNKVSPTTLECHGQNIGAALLVTAPVQNGARSFLIPYRALVRNMDSLSTATNVQLSDDINATFPTARSIVIVAPGEPPEKMLAERLWLPGRLARAPTVSVAPPSSALR